MTAALRQPSMTRDEFLDWVETQELRYEFDGFDPVPMFDPSAPAAMAGGTANHEQICQNIYFALRTRLAGTACRVLGPNAGVATVGTTIRFPDALITCAKFPGTDRIIPGVVATFEVVSPTSGRMDRVTKLAEYRAVASVRRYVLLEYEFAGLTVFERVGDGPFWNSLGLAGSDVLHMPDLGVSIPVTELYDSVDLPEPGTA